MTAQRHFPRRILLAGSAGVAAGAALETVPAAAATSAERADFATWDPITGRSTTAMSPARVTMHIAAVRGTDIYGPDKGPGNSYAHFYNPRSAVLRQHQEMTHRGAADLNGNNLSISVEHEGLEGDSMTDKQITDLAKILAWAHVHCGVPNRIATVGNLSGLAWHRLGIDGNFGAFDPDDRTTWCRDQTGAEWSSATGKTCPTNVFINELDEVYRRAQGWIDTFGG